MGEDANNVVIPDEGLGEKLVVLVGSWGFLQTDEYLFELEDDVFIQVLLGVPAGGEEFFGEGVVVVELLEEGDGVAGAAGVDKSDVLALVPGVIKSILVFQILSVLKFLVVDLFHEKLKDSSPIVFIADGVGKEVVEGWRILFNVVIEDSQEEFAELLALEEDAFNLFLNEALDIAEEDWY